MKLSQEMLSSTQFSTVSLSSPDANAEMERRKTSCGPEAETFTRRSVIVERTTTTTHLALAVPTADFHTVVMVSKILAKLAIKENGTPTSPTLADPTAFFHSVVMESLTASTVKPVMTEITDLVMVVMPTAKRSAETVFSMPTNNATMDHTTLTLRPTNAEPTANSSLVVMVSLTSMRNVTSVLLTATLHQTAVDPAAHFQSVETEWSTLPTVRPVTMETKSTVMVAMPTASPSVETVLRRELRNVMMEAATPTLFLMHADLTVVFQDVVTVFVMPTNNATLELTLLNAKTALLDVETESWNLERNAIMEFTTLILWPMAAEPTAVLHTVATESLMPSRNVMLELPTQILQTSVELGAVFLSAVMALLMLETRRPVMTETPLMEMVATLAANVSAETDVLTLVSNAMLELETQTLALAAAAQLAHSQFVVMVLPTSVRSAIMEETTPSDQTLADLTAPCQNAVMESSTIFMEKSAIKEEETPGQLLMDAPQTAHQTFADKASPSTPLSTQLTGFQNKPEFTTTRALTLMLLTLRTSTGLSLLHHRQFLHASWLSSERF
jgi:hypothetical protein